MLLESIQHITLVMFAEGFPDRMQATKEPIDVMYENERYGQKDNKLLSIYTRRKGKPKATDESVYELLKGVQKMVQRSFKREVIERLMIPMIIETALFGRRYRGNTQCLIWTEWDWVSLHSEVVLGYADTLGLAAVCEIADKYAHLGEVYQPTQRMREMAANGEPTTKVNPLRVEVNTNTKHLLKKIGKNP